MSVPKELMSLMSMSGGGGEKAAPGPNAVSAAAGGNAPPPGGPMTTPQPKEGEDQAALVNIAIAIQLLEQSLPAFGSPTPRGKAVLSSLKTLTNEFGKDRQQADSLIPAELMQLVQSIPGAGGGSPAAKAMGGMPPGQPAIPQGAPA